MNREKLIRKFLLQPESLKYRQIEKLLLYLGFEMIFAKGSHRKFKHPAMKEGLIIPVHNNDCKNYYKKVIAEIIIENKLYEKNY